MPSRPLLRFDAFGPVEAVLHRIDTDIPHIFPEHASGFTAALKRMVRFYSHQYGWQTVVLSVNQGLPAEEMELFLKSAPAHRGGLVVDPSLLTEGEKVYADYEALKADSEGLVMLTQSRDDVMAILYGADGISHAETVRLVQARLAMMNMSFEMLKVDLRADPRGSREELELTKDLKRLEAARNALGEVNLILDKNITDNIDPDGNHINGAIFDAREELHYLVSRGYDPMLQHNFRAADWQLQNVPQELNLAPPPPPAEPRPAPQPARDLRHNPIYKDEMNPNPKMR
jgi:hypothetical protein